MQIDLLLCGHLITLRKSSSIVMRFEKSSSFRRQFIFPRTRERERERERLDLRVCLPITSGILTSPILCLWLLKIKERYYLIFPWKLHNMILPKEVAQMRHGPSHCLETNHAIYSISDVVRQIVSARCPQGTTVQSPLLIILTSLHCSQDISSLQYFLFSKNLVKDIFCEQ